MWGGVVLGNARLRMVGPDGPAKQTPHHGREGNAPAQLAGQKPEGRLRFVVQYLTYLSEILIWKKQNHGCYSRNFYSSRKSMYSATVCIIYSLSVPGGFVALACRQKSPLFVDATACSFSWLFVWFVADDLSFAVRARGTSIGASYAGLMKSFPWPFSASCGRL